MMQRLPRAASLLQQTRHFRTGRSLKITENKQSTGIAGVLEADNTPLTMKAVHLSSAALAVLVPTALVLSPSSLNMPVDLALGVIIPAHAHIGMNGIVSDYVPKNVQTLARLGLIGVTGLTTLGLLCLNVSGPGLTETVKSVWREPTNKNKC